MLETSGDIIHIDKDRYMVNSVGYRIIRFSISCHLTFGQLLKSINISINKEARNLKLANSVCCVTVGKNESNLVRIPRNHSHNYFES